MKTGRAIYECCCVRIEYVLELIKLKGEERHITPQNNTEIQLIIRSRPRIRTSREKGPLSIEKLELIHGDLHLGNLAVSHMDGPTIRWTLSHYKPSE